MQLQIDFWELLLAIGALVVAFSTVIWLFGNMSMHQFEKRLNEKFITINTVIEKHLTEEEKVADQLKTFEMDFLKFQRDMPIEYVRREDYIRGQSVIEAKLDALYSKMELVFLRGSKHD